MDLTSFFIRTTESCHVFPTFNSLLFNSVKVISASKKNGNQKDIFICKLILKFFQNFFPLPTLNSLMVATALVTRAQAPLFTELCREQENILGPKYLFNERKE